MLNAKKLIAVVAILSLICSAVIYAVDQSSGQTDQPTIRDFLTEEQCRACRIDSLTPIQQRRVIQGLLDDRPLSFTELTAETRMIKDGYHKFILAAIVPHEWSNHRHYAIVIDKDRVFCLESPVLTEPLVPGVYWTDYVGMGVFFDIVYPDGDEEMFRVLD